MPVFDFDYTNHLTQLLPLLHELDSAGEATPPERIKILKKHRTSTGGFFTKDQVLSAYRALAGTNGLAPFNPVLAHHLKLKPTRTLSGVTPITVLTKPFPCPGKCIFCPNDVRMPKSYLSDEPGAQRAERNYFDPYLQAYSRLQALHNIGHTVDKAEVIVLGGTWSYYPEAYQIWFIKECFRALNDFGHHDDRSDIEKKYERMEATLKDKNLYAASNDPVTNKSLSQQHQVHGEDMHKSYNRTVSEMYVAPERLAGFDAYQKAEWSELENEQKINETASTRCVGLVIETRPDNISEAEVLRIRRLGCTKAQIGFQSLQDDVLAKNNRGHDVAATRRAVKLLRQAGFKIHAHWMANLYGSSVEKDKADYLALFSDEDFKPDELKIYPCSLIESAELMQYYKKGLWKPYSYEELLDILTFCLLHTPEYTRLTRVIRDIPSTDIVVGNKKTNFRQIAEQALEKAHLSSQDIRAREIRGEKFDASTLQLSEASYQTAVGTEIFLQYTALNDIKETKLLAFLRLSLPKEKSFITELSDSAVIREVHVYGETVGVGLRGGKRAQHLGLGTLLMQRAVELARKSGYTKLQVISAIGTREYYRKKGFSDGKLYQFMELSGVEGSASA